MTLLPLVVRVELFRMALLNRLFPNKKRSRKQGYVPFGRNEYSRWKPFSFTRDQVRLLLFRECDARGRKLLFDSSAVQKTNIDGNQSSRSKLGLKNKCDNIKKTETYVEVTNGYGYQYTRPNSDVTLMGEMIFGSVAMTYKGMSSKIHSMKSPDRFMCSRVFHAPAIHLNCKRKSDQSIDSSGSSVSSINDSLFSLSGNYESKLGSSGGSGPLDVPFSNSSVKVPKNSLEGDSGFCGDASLRSISSVGSGFWNSFPYLNEVQNGSLVMSPGNVNNSGGSLASLQRRWMRNLNTSLEFGLTSSHWYLKGKVLSQLSDEGFCRPHRKTQLGLTVVITLTPEEEKEMEVFFFDHVAVIDNILERLQNNIEKAYMKKEVFVHSMMDAFLELQQWFCDLFTAPRLSTPVWIGLVSSSDFYRESSRLRFDVASAFLRDLCQLIASIDTKATNFFISTLVTAVLTHHLGWVATILPAKAPPSSVTKSPCTVQILHALAKSHPYNALWAQLGDLHGAVGNPVKIARTIVTANVKKNELLNKLLCCLSYFIRCGNIEKRTDNQIAKESEMNIVDSAMKSLSLASLNSSTASSSTIVPDDSPCFEKQDKNLLTDASKIFNLSQRTFSTNSNERSVDGDSLIKDNTFPHSFNTSLDQGGSGFHKSRTLAANLNISCEEKEVKQTDGRSSATDSYLHPDVISEKVSRLCRVPTNALLYHMKTAPSIPSAETFVPQKIDCEKQLSSVEVSDRRRSVVVANPRSESMSNKSSSDKKSNEGVIFVLGDNDKLVDLKCQNGFSITKSKSENILSGEKVCLKSGEVKCCPSLGGWKHTSKSSSNFPCLTGISDSGGMFCEVEGQVSADVNRSSSHENYFANQEETGLDSGIVLEDDTSTKFSNPISVCVSDEDALWKNERTNQTNSENCCVVVGSSSLLQDVNGNPRLDVKQDDCESKVVTSHSLVIELEDVHKYKDVKIPHVPKKYSKQVSRSQSLSFPENKYLSKGRTASICRRHSENIHLNERYLRNYHSVRFNFERCDGVLSDYVDGIDVEKSPRSENSKKLFDARENFELQEKCESCKCAEQGIVFNSVLCSSNTCNCVSDLNIANECVDHVSSKSKADCDEREGNALFDDYGLLSDEELQTSIEVNPGSVPSTSEKENTAFPLLLELPLPQYNYSQREQMSGFAASLLGGVSDHYMPDMVLHGCTQGVSQWEATLKRDLSVSAHRSMLDQDVSEAVCIVGNADLWEVQVVSSQITLADKPGGFGIRIGMSQLVANMLESLLHLWKLRTPPEQCLQHLESKLRELCLRSQALAELLMTTEFCDLATVTSSLGLEANDVPLLLAIASTHTPQVTSQYGLSFH